MKKRFSMRALVFLLLPLLVSCAPTTNDPVLEDRIDEVLEAFVENHATSYLQPATYDYQIVASLKKMDVLTQFPSETTALSASLLSLDTSSMTLNQWLKAIVALDALGESTTSFVNENLNTVLANETSIGQYASPSTLQITTLLDDDNYNVYQQAAISDLTTTNTPRNNDIDWGASIALSLIPYRDNEAVSAVLATYFDWLPTVQATDGSFVESFSWSTANSAILANVILALTAYGTDPCAAPFTDGEDSMVEVLLTYANSDGSFRYAANDEEADLAFSTPLAIAALVAYQQFADDSSTRLFE